MQSTFFKRISFNLSLSVLHLKHNYDQYYWKCLRSHYEFEFMQKLKKKHLFVSVIRRVIDVKCLHRFIYIAFYLFISKNAKKKSGAIFPSWLNWSLHIYSFEVRFKAPNQYPPKCNVGFMMSFDGFIDILNMNSFRFVLWPLTQYSLNVAYRSQCNNMDLQQPATV